MNEHTRQSKKSGLPPGTLMHVGKKRTNQVEITVIDYTETNYNESTCKTIKECFPFKETPTTSWINIDGIHDTDIIEVLGSHFEYHPLLMEDIVNTLGRPKLEEFQDHLYLSLKMLGIDKNGSSIISEQVSFILGKNYVISFQEQPGDIFESIRVRIREAKGNIRNRKADYLFYRLIDAIVDNYFFVIDFYSDRIEDLENRVMKAQNTEILNEIQDLKTQLLHLRKLISPLRDPLGSLQKDDIQLIDHSTNHYFNDIYEHLIQVIESVEIYREMTKNLMDLYQSGINNKTNQVMQVLTIIATIFIPLTFIVGVYGMNFKYMPELEWRYGYFATLFGMVVIVLFMLKYFERKGWF